MRVRLALLTVLVLGASAGCSDSSLSKDAAARVCGVTISRAQLDELVAQTAGSAKHSGAKYREIRDQQLAVLVERVELEHQARTLAIHVDEELLARRVAQLVR